MRNKIAALCLSAGMVIANVSIAQNIHVVKMGETLSTIAHKSHVTVGDLMRYNNLNSKSKLQIGEHLKIPAKGAKETVSKEETPEVKKVAAKQKEEKVAPPAKTHVVAQGESLFRISRDNKVSVAKLREWNSLPDYTIKIGQELFVSEPSEDEKKAIQPAKAVDDGSPKPVLYQSDEKKTEAPVVVNKPAEIKSETANKIPAQVTTKVEAKKEDVKEVVAPVVAAPAKKVDDAVKTEAKVEPVVVKTEPVKPVEAVKPLVKSSGKTSVTDQGFFASQFVSSKQEVVGTAGILKTSSGWIDKKYYVLMNNVPPGTIVKITVNNNTIYAKVLEALPDVKEDQGLLLRISNAAASVLNVSESKFQAVVNY